MGTRVADGVIGPIHVEQGNLVSTDLDRYTLALGKVLRLCRLMKSSHGSDSSLGFEHVNRATG